MGCQVFVARLHVVAKHGGDDRDADAAANAAEQVEEACALGAKSWVQGCERH